MNNGTSTITKGQPVLHRVSFGKIGRWEMAVIGNSATVGDGRFVQTRVSRSREGVSDGEFELVS